MDQRTFAEREREHEPKKRRTGREVFLAKMARLLPRDRLAAEIARSIHRLAGACVRIRRG